LQAQGCDRIRLVVANEQLIPPGTVRELETIGHDTNVEAGARA